MTGKLVAHEITPGEFFDRLTILELKADKLHGDTPSITDELLCYVELARSVYVTNDLRNAAKRAIDQHFNVPPEVKEYKSYGEEDSEARQHQPGHA